MLSLQRVKLFFPFAHCRRRRSSFAPLRKSPLSRAADPQASNLFSRLALSLKQRSDAPSKAHSRLPLTFFLSLSSISSLASNQNHRIYPSTSSTKYQSQANKERTIQQHKTQKA